MSPLWRQHTTCDPCWVIGVNCLWFLFMVPNSSFSPVEVRTFCFHFFPHFPPLPVSETQSPHFLISCGCQEALLCQVYQTQVRIFTRLIPCVGIIAVCVLTLVWGFVHIPPKELARFIVLHECSTALAARLNHLDPGGSLSPVHIFGHFCYFSDLWICDHAEVGLRLKSNYVHITFS